MPQLVETHCVCLWGQFGPNRRKQGMLFVAAYSLKIFFFLFDEVMCNWYRHQAMNCTSVFKRNGKNKQRKLNNFRPNRLQLAEGKERFKA